MSQAALRTPAVGYLYTTFCNKNNDYISQFHFYNFLIIFLPEICSDLDFVVIMMNKDF